MRKIRGSSWLIAAGLVLVLAAVVLAGYNLLDENRVSKTLDRNVTRLAETIAENREQEEKRKEELGGDVVPEYILNPDAPLPEETVDGYAYVGLLTVSRFDNPFPIIGAWSEAALKQSPCVYSGSPYTGCFVVCGYNYRVHFAYLKRLEEGDRITFTDIIGNEFRYTVVAVETLTELALEQSGSDGFDLTVFSCTVDGQSQVAVRCVADETN